LAVPDNDLVSQGFPGLGLGSAGGFFPPAISYLLFTEYQLMAYPYLLGGRAAAASPQNGECEMRNLEIQQSRRGRKVEDK